MIIKIQQHLLKMETQQQIQEQLTKVQQLEQLQETQVQQIENILKQQQ